MAQKSRFLQVRDCLGDVVRSVIQEVDPDQAVSVRTYLQLRGLGAQKASFFSSAFPMFVPRQAT